MGQQPATCRPARSATPARDSHSAQFSYILHSDTEHAHLAALVFAKLPQVNTGVYSTILHLLVSFLLLIDDDEVGKTLLNCARAMMASMTSGPRKTGAGTAAEVGWHSLRNSEHESGPHRRPTLMQSLLG